MKSAIKFRLFENVKAIAIFYTVIYAILISITVLNIKITGSGGQVENGGIEFATFIFLFIAGLNSFKPEFRFFLANGVSRKNMMISFFASAGVIVSFMAIVDGINAWVVAKLIRYKPIYQQIYERLYTDTFSMKDVFDALLWSVMGYALFFMIGFFISVLYYRLNKPLKLLVSIGVPGFFTVILPFINSLTGGRAYSAIASFFAAAFGANGGLNPYGTMIFFLIATVLFALFSYLLIRRAVLKETA